MSLNKHRDAPEDNSGAVIVWAVIAGVAWLVMWVVVIAVAVLAGAR